MRTEDFVDTALKGFDQRELVAILVLHALEQWQADDAARQTMIGQLSSNTPAARYLAGESCVNGAGKLAKHGRTWLDSRAIDPMPLE